jgi:hypothetical protein
MNTYFLFDGAMVHSALGTSRIFAQADAPWFATLMPSNELRLAGPILISKAAAVALKSEAVVDEYRRIARAFPHLLHIATIESAQALDQLAAHLRTFIYFADDTGQPYGLRIADGRVMAYLPGVLTPSQWDALTAPIGAWRIHDRTGTEKALVLNETRLERTGAPEPLVLSDAQIEQLMQAGEPDALLAQLDMPPESAAPRDVKWQYDVAGFSISHWQKSGSSDRRVLLAFARRVFASGGAWVRDAARVQQELKAAAARIS